MAGDDIFCEWPFSRDSEPEEMEHLEQFKNNDLASGKRLHNYGKIHHFSWEKPRFHWPFSIAMLNYQRVI